MYRAHTQAVFLSLLFNLNKEVIQEGVDGEKERERREGGKST